MVRPAWRAAFALALAGSLCAPLRAGEQGNREQEIGDRGSSRQPLHERIDQLVEAAAIGPLARICNDADFVRRAYLDFTGVIPTADQARAFLADKAGNKRERLIDELLASSAFVRHMTITFDVMLMERK